MAFCYLLLSLPLNGQPLPSKPWQQYQKKDFSFLYPPEYVLEEAALDPLNCSGMVNFKYHKHWEEGVCDIPECGGPMKYSIFNNFEIILSDSSYSEVLGTRLLYKRDHKWYSGTYGEDSESEMDAIQVGQWNGYNVILGVPRSGAEYERYLVEKDLLENCNAFVVVELWGGWIELDLLEKVVESIEN